MTPEAQNVVWKSSWRDEYLAWICGFANAQGGVLEIGRNDRGEQLREGAYLKRAAVLLFHPAPHRLVSEAYVKIGYFRGTEILYQDIVQGDLFSQIDRAMELLYSKYSRALISYDGIYRVETVPVPRDAMREAVTNAVMHRDYASPTSTQIRVYDDRISIGNAAQLPADWTAPSDRAMQSRPHNPQVAHAFFRAGMIEAWGRGIPRITELCRDAGNPPPTWEVQPGGILRVRFPFSAAYQEADRRVRTGEVIETGTTRQSPDTTRSGDAATGGTTGGTTQETTRRKSDTTQETTPKAAATTQETVRNSTRRRILSVLSDEPRITQVEIAERLGITRDGVAYHFRKLRAEGIIRRVGSRKSGHWEVVK